MGKVEMRIDKCIKANIIYYRIYYNRAEMFNMVQNKPFRAKFRFDTANELSDIEVLMVLVILANS